ncbi:hypothetical protein CLV46_0783 [Diaminobutyricimonas aerilata]|uniref:Uncharacterized protein n=1 Tax=Diaminobutyricimonas aerilata TaxID=1162967 RepID=A0A2M9CH42_9MICO|nr:hypothetical protein [Diaminobutyricimonas aerilata]PJJ71241.1 hypothetical protein CLV46_0783 [Diaminobutyricimonas aerilata]
MTTLLLVLLLLASVAVAATVVSVARDGYHRVPVRAGLPHPDRVDRR